jgi:phage tail protein X
MTQYRTKTGDMIDALCFHFYGRQAQAVEQVYEANRGLADAGPVLPSGMIIELPEIPAAAAAKTIKLWD